MQNNKKMDSAERVGNVVNAAIEIRNRGTGMSFVQNNKELVKDIAIGVADTGDTALNKITTDPTTRDSVRKIAERIKKGE